MSVAQQLDHLRHVSGKARQIAGQILCVADIGIDVGENRHIGIRLAGQRQSGPGHQRKQADDLQRDSLASRIGTGNHQNLYVVIKPDVVGHHMLF